MHNRPINVQEAKLATNNLNKQCSFLSGIESNWNMELYKNNGNSIEKMQVGEGKLVLSFNTISPLTASEIGLKIQEAGIKFHYECTKQSCRGLKNGLFALTFIIAHPAEIRALAQNNFEFPPLTIDIMTKAVMQLEQITGDKWEIYGPQLTCSIRVSADSWQDAEKAYKLKAKLWEIPSQSFHATKRGLQETTFATVISKISNPFDIKALSEMTLINKNDIQSCPVTPNMAATLYKEVAARNSSDELEGLTNEVIPEKFNKALKILGIAVKEVQFSNRNGYIITTDGDNIRKLNEILQIKNEEKLDATKSSTLPVNTI